MPVDELKKGDLCIFQHTCQRGCHVERENVTLVDEVSGRGDHAFIWGYEYYKTDGRWHQSTSRSLADQVRLLTPKDERPYNSTVNDIA